MILYGSSTEIPDELLLAHEEGKVVFFCGAGISYDAGIPLFVDLVSKTARKANIELGEEDCASLQGGNCDVVYQEMERRVGSAKRTWLRHFTARLLSRPRVVSDEALSYHYSLLKLSRVRATKKLHLVTTNYDSLFDIAEKRLRKKKAIDERVFAYAAPLLPVPKQSKWDGLIYLHGKLQPKKSDDNLNSLIISSGDFGVAYLTERWASRFVSELFRKYTICFVGYSANDTIMRYMVDALAADKLMGEEQHMVYAFDGYEGDGRDSLVEQWAKKGINVIPFKKERKGDFSELKRTLTAWSDFYSAGVSGPVRIIMDEAPRKPNTISPDGVSSIKRVIWALRRNDTLPVIRFANLDTPPPLEWFDVFFDEQSESNLTSKKRECQIKPLLPFSCEDRVDDYLKCILSWLAKHLDDPTLLARFCRITKPLSPYVITRLEEEVLCREGMPEQLRKLWLLWLESTRTTRIYIGNTSICPWISTFKQMDHCLGGEFAFSEFIRPYLYLLPQNTLTHDVDTEDLRTNFTWEYRVRADDMDVRTLESYGLKLEEIPASAFPVVEMALLQLCKMRREMGDEQDEHDHSDYYVQDISGPIDDDNEVNGSGWGILVLLMRSVWYRLLTTNHQVATRIAKNWFNSPHPIFKRLALYAVTKDSDLDPNRTIKWLIANPKERLFGNTYCREILNLLSACGKRLSQQTLAILDKVLSSYREDIPSPRRESRRALFVERLEGSAVELPTSMRKFLEKYRKEHVGWTKRNKKFDGLSFWVSDGSDEDWVDESTAEQTSMPDDNKAIAIWLKDYERFQFADTRSDPWRKFCRENFDRACMILISEDLVNSSYRNAWSGMLIEACKKDNAHELWGQMPKNKIVDWVRSSNIVADNFSSIAEWFRLLSGCDVEPDLYLNLADALMSHQEARIARRTEYEVIMEGVLRRWYATKPAADSKIQAPFVEFFESVIRGTGESSRCARNELLTQLSNLALVDKEWTFETIVPRLSWKMADAIEFWRAAIKMTWLNWELLQQIRGDFIDTATHYKELESSGEWYVNVFTVMATSKNNGYGARTYREILRMLPSEGKLAVANRIKNMLHNAGDKIDILWNEEISPFVKNIWPPDKNCMSPEIAGNLFSGIAYCGEAFPDASSTLLALYRGNVELRDVAFRLANSPKGTESHSKRYPDQVLDILSRVNMERKAFDVALWIGKCLEIIKSIPNPKMKGNGTYESDERYINLMAYVLRNRH